MDLTLPIIGLISASGYYFVKDGKLPRQEEKVRKNIVKNEDPTGTNIYTSVHSRQTDNMFKEVLHDRFEKSKEFPKQNVFSYISDVSMNVDTNNHTKKENYKNISKNEAEKSELFKPANYLNQLKEAQNTLTGKPMETVHTNMQPHFKGMMPKGNFSAHGSERRLELLTGVSKLYTEKQEVPALFDPVQTKFPNLEMVDRQAVFNSVSEKKPFMEPYQQIDVVPFPVSSLRPEYKKVDEMRKYNKLVAKGVNNTPSSRTKISASVGEDVNQPSRNITGLRLNGVKASSRMGARKSGEYTHESHEITDPYDNLFLSTPRFGYTTTTNLDTDYTQQPNNVDIREVLGEFSNPSVKRRARGPSNYSENLKLTERGDTLDDTFSSIPNKKRQGRVRTNFDAKHTLKEGNLYQHTANPHSKRGVNITVAENSSKSLRDVTGDNDNYYTTFNVGPSVNKNTVNERLREPEDFSRLNLPDGRQKFSNRSGGENKLRTSLNNTDNFSALKDDVNNIRKQTAENPFFIKKY